MEKNGEKKMKNKNDLLLIYPPDTSSPRFFYPFHSHHYPSLPSPPPLLQSLSGATPALQSYISGGNTFPTKISVDFRVVQTMSPVINDVVQKKR
jgi:hypothetical protein